MGPVWALVLLLPLLTQGAEDYCDARQNKSQCYGALGGTIQIRLMDNASEIYRCIWRKGSRNIFELKNNKVTIKDQKDSVRYRDIEIDIPSNGTYHLRNLTESDSGTYSLEIYNSSGITTKKLIHELFIEAPVSSVLLEHQCLSKGEKRVTCTPHGGDSPEYSWTLNGQTLTDSQLLSKNHENNITLRQDVEGLLRCSVKNHISQVQVELTISTCGYIFINCTLNGTEISDWVFKANNTLCIEQTTTPTPITSMGKTPAMTTSTSQSVDASNPSGSWYIRNLPVIAGVLVTIVLVAVVALICLLKKKRTNSGDEEHEEELTYADVSILQQPGRRQPQTSEMEVEYDQVKFSNRSQRISEAADNACIYAQVRR